MTHLRIMMKFSLKTLQTKRNNVVDKLRIDGRSSSWTDKRTCRRTHTITLSAQFSLASLKWLDSVCKSRKRDKTFIPELRYVSSSIQCCKENIVESYPLKFSWYETWQTFIITVKWSKYILSLKYIITLRQRKPILYFRNESFSVFSVKRKHLFNLMQAIKITGRKQVDANCSH